jgi:hypothetical protein
MHMLGGLFGVYLGYFVLIPLSSYMPVEQVNITALQFLRLHCLGWWLCFVVVCWERWLLQWKLWG